MQVGLSLASWNLVLQKINYANRGAIWLALVLVGVDRKKEKSWLTNASSSTKIVCGESFDCC